MNLESEKGVAFESGEEDEGAAYESGMRGLFLPLMALWYFGP
jgi:hypothetical protein